MLKAFLLSAGLGRRLRPLTNETPKCLLPIDGKPLLQFWLEHLSQHGIDEVLVNSHWLHERVETFLDSFRQNAHCACLSVKLFHEPELLGSAGTLLANKDWVEDGEPFFILYGDNVTNVNLTDMLSFHTQHGLPFTLGVFKTKTPRECGIADVREDGVVTGFLEKPEKPRSDLAAAGIYIANQTIFQFFPEQESTASPPLDLGFHIIPRLVGKMKAYFIQEFLMDIGTPESYEKVQTLWTEVKS